MNPKNQMLKRRTYFLDKRSQGKFILNFIAVSLAGGVISVGIFVTLAIRKLDTIRFSMRLPDSYASQLLMNDMLVATAISLGMTLTAFVVITNFVIRKMNDPLTEINKTLKLVSAGKTNSLVDIEKAGDFVEFSKEVNEMIRQLQTRFQKIQKCNNALTEAVQDAQRTQDKNHLKEILSPHILALDEAVKSLKV